MQRGSLKSVKDRRGVNVWRAQWREHGKGRTRILGRVIDITRAEARAMLDRILEPLGVRRTTRRAAAVTLRAFVENEYLVTKSRGWKTSTRITTEQIIGTHILAELGKRPLVEITRHELQIHIDGKAAAGLSFSVVEHVRWQLVAIFRMASADGLIRVDPAAGLVSPRCAGVVDTRTITAEDLQRAQRVLDFRERLIFRLTGCEGMRPGEIVGLQLSDIAEGVIHIHRRIYRGKLDTPKSVRSRRAVPLTPITLAILMQYLELLKDQRPEAWLFPSETGSTPLNYADVYRRRIQPRLAKIGLGHVNAQILRRTWVSEMAEVEKDPKVRASLAGHSTDVSENTYRQVPVASLKRTMKRLGKLLQ